MPSEGADTPKHPDGHTLSPPPTAPRVKPPSSVWVMAKSIGWCSPVQAQVLCCCQPSRTTMNWAAGAVQARGAPGEGCSRRGVPQERGAPASWGGRTPLPTCWAPQEAPPASTQPPAATGRAKFSPFPAPPPSLRQPKIQLTSSDAAAVHQLSPSGARQLCLARGVIYSTAHIPPLLPPPQQSPKGYAGVGRRCGRGTATELS